MVKKIELVLFDEENEEMFNVLNDMFNDMFVLIERGELDEVPARRFMKNMKVELYTRAELGYWYINENRRDVGGDDV